MSKAMQINDSASSLTIGCNGIKNISRPVFMVWYDIWSKSNESGSLASKFLVLVSQIPSSNFRSTLGTFCTYYSIGIHSDKYQIVTLSKNGIDRAWLGKGLEKVELG